MFAMSGLGFRVWRPDKHPRRAATFVEHNEIGLEISEMF
jgi:hypothetical protein